MGAIKTSLVLNDGMTAVLQRINRVMNLTIGTFETMQKTSGKAMNTKQISEMRSALNDVNDAVNAISRGYSECSRKQSELNNKISQGAAKSGGLLDKIKGVAKAYAGIQTVKALVDLSDTQTQTSARLGLMAKNFGGTGSAEEVTAMRSALFASAQRSRGDYQTTADSVSKLGLMAGSAFTGPQEIIDFTEQLNKKFKIAGTSSAGIDAAMLQLTQAMGSGVLRGEEFNSVLEQSPNIIQSIAKYMKVPQGKLKDMASDGLITAQKVKQAILADADETNAAFNSIPMTWADVWTSAKNRGVQALEPLLNKINELANMPEVEQTVDGIINAFSSLTEVVGVVFGWICKIYSFIASNWSVIAPIVYGIAAAFGVYNGVLAAHSAYLAVAAAIKVLATAAEYRSAKAKIKTAKASAAVAAAAGVETAATKEEALAKAEATVAQASFNTVLLACPLTLIVGAIIIVVAAIYMLVAWINRTKNTTISATGVVLGVLGVAVAVVYNTVIVPIWHYFAWLVNFIGNAFNDPCAAIDVAFLDMCLSVLGYVKTLAAGIETLLNKIPGVEVSITTGLDGFYEKIEAAQKKIKTKFEWKEYVKQPDYVDYSAAYQKGYSFGSNIDDKIGSITDKLKMPDLSGMQSTVADIAGSSKKTAKNTDKTKEELKYLRDIAERDAINRFTTAEIKVDMTGMTNSINSSADIDGILSKFTDGLEEALLTAAEGVAR